MIVMDTLDSSCCLTSSVSSSAEDGRIFPSTSTRLYRCQLCGVSRSKRSLMLSHMQKCHPHSLLEFCVEGKERRRYKCPICGDYRSKISMLRKHMQEAHSHSTNQIKEVCESSEEGNDPQYLLGTKKRKCFECNECGMLFKKPSVFKQHLFTHAPERPFKCPKDGCDKCYKRPDHLKRHLLRHGEMPKPCPWPGCIMVCSNQCSFHRHLHRHYRKGDSQSGNLNTKVFKCPDPDCNAVFAYPCRLESHCSIVHGMYCAEFFCGEPGCGKAFDSAKLLQEHIRQSHKTIICHICGSSILRKHSTRHVEAHDPNRVKQRLFCPVDNCSRSYSNSFNLSVHVKVSHLGTSPIYVF
ncbi:hypothetical protein KP509_22G042900 [Ceratopteris richardii]|uniref:C2H2-type domain-containing protein n=1 Tax=Ceratopteris richardii TaxID=49495 RepID=A0A8T2S6D9_CERRI|nr:hypothetical protein KP509_22G042900 [Ceratopteris richardii]